MRALTKINAASRGQDLAVATSQDACVVHVQVACSDGVLHRTLRRRAYSDWRTLTAAQFPA